MLHGSLRAAEGGPDGEGGALVRSEGGVFEGPDDELAGARCHGPGAEQEVEAVGEQRGVAGIDLKAAEVERLRVVAP